MAMENQTTNSWKNKYIWVLVANAIYILIFYLLSVTFN